MKLDDKTLIPLWSVLTAVPFIIGGIMWITYVYSDVAQAKQNIEKLEEHQDKNSDLLLEIRDRVIRIEERITTNGK